MIKRILSVVLAALMLAALFAPCAQAKDAQPCRNPHFYQVEQTTASFVDMQGRTISAIVFYPSARANSRPLRPRDRFPGVVFLQGQNIVADRYAWLEHLAASGYIVIIPDTPPIMVPDPSGQIVPVVAVNVDIMDRSIQWLRTWSEDETSPIHGRLDPSFAIAGHSWGGTVALIGSDPNGCAGHPYSQFASCPPDYSPDSDIEAIWIIGGHHQSNDPDPTSPLAKPDGVSLYMIAAENDGLATPAKVTATYARYEEPKLYWELPGGNHYGWTSYPDETDLTQLDGEATITREVQQALTVYAGATFFHCALGGRRAACRLMPTGSISE